MSGSLADVEYVYVTEAAQYTGLGNEAVTLTDASVGASGVNAIAQKTTGVVTATVSDAPATVLVGALGAAQSTDVLTLTVLAESSGATPAAALKDLDGKTSLQIQVHGGLTQVSGSLADVEYVYVTEAAQYKIGRAHV